MGCQRFLRDQSTPCPIKAILAATSYDYEAGRKMLMRMRLAGELVSFPGSLCTITHQPCLATFILPDPLLLLIKLPVRTLNKEKLPLSGCPQP